MVGDPVLTRSATMRANLCSTVGKMKDAPLDKTRKQPKDSNGDAEQERNLNDRKTPALFTIQALLAAPPVSESASASVPRPNRIGTASLTFPQGDIHASANRKLPILPTSAHEQHPKDLSGPALPRCQLRGSWTALRTFRVAANAPTAFKPISGEVSGSAGSIRRNTATGNRRRKVSRAGRDGSYR